MKLCCIYLHINTYFCVIDKIYHIIKSYRDMKYNIERVTTPINIDRPEMTMDKIMKDMLSKLITEVPFEELTKIVSVTFSVKKNPLKCVDVSGNPRYINTAESTISLTLITDTE